MDEHTNGETGEKFLHLLEYKGRIFTDCISDCIHYNGDECEHSKTCLRLAIDYYDKKNITT